MPLESPDKPLRLWDFSLKQYARSGVADACLHLQDEHGVNVNVMLWCLWLGEQGVELDGTRLVKTQKCIEAWDEHYVIPLRALRRRMKAEFGVDDLLIEQLRGQIKQAELLAEKRLQMWLEEEALPWFAAHEEVAGHSVVEDNLCLYLQQYDVPELAVTKLLNLLAGADERREKN